MKINSRNELPEVLLKRGLDVGAEIGVFKGEYTERFCKAGLNIYAIDPWMPFWGQGRTQNKQEVQDGYFFEAIERLKPYSDSCTIIRKTSMDALADFKDESLGFVYIDGDHSFKHIAADIVEWEKKVKKGGIVAGHDYFNTAPHANNVLCHVKSVVDAYVDCFDKELYIYGDEHGEGKERKKSWLFVK